ncbi:MAG: class I SAM-dependent methyltransferase [Deltaproteobacteria bacterium]|nr:MAG: class I SAM-dependent methyltransferase [Deltaproteobacteria bacterium]
MNFKDYFSKQASEYTRYRPHYPGPLFQYLAELTIEHQLAWDCATGSGQAALGLTPYFDEIIATDASEKQITNAILHSNITYLVSPAEQTEIDSNAVDLIVVAQALHWFDLDKFYGEVKRVLKAGGVIAAWSYGLLRISPPVDELIDKFYVDVVGPFWPPERKLVDDGYRSIPFPFQEFTSPAFSMEANWSLDHLLGYIGTWSSIQKFKEQNKANPLKGFARDLKQVWGRLEDEKRVRWPINMRVGRML